MPKQPINYDNTCFYKIVCKDLTISDIYVGHTTDFKKRKAEHKKKCNNENLSCLPLYLFMRANGGWDNFDMILLERRSCQDILETRKIERTFIEELKPSLNRYVPSRTRPEYYQDNREKTINRVKSYYQDNAEKCKEWKNSTVVCSCGHSYTKANKARPEKTQQHQTYLLGIEVED